MPDYQPIDYRLRCHTKRTDLPADILRDIGEAYEEIGRLQKERNEARKDRAAYRIEIDRLIGQRDEARREVCGFHHLTGFLAGDYANSRGWDCFKDHPRGLGFPPSVNDFKIFLEGQDKIFLDKIDRLTAERDEARREVCQLMRADDYNEPFDGTVFECATHRGWDCFNAPEGKLDKTLNGVIVDGGKAIPPKYEDLGDE